jgi:hypothetical protein
MLEKCHNAAAELPTGGKLFQHTPLESSLTPAGKKKQPPCCARRLGARKAASFPVLDGSQPSNTKFGVLKRGRTWS